MSHNNMSVVDTEVGLSIVSILAVSHRFSSFFSSVHVTAVASKQRICVFNDSKTL